MITGVHVVAKRTKGKPVRWYIYASRGGPRIRTVIGGPRPKLTAADGAALQAIIEAAKAPTKDTLAELIRAYRKSPEWAKLAVSTKRQWLGRHNLIEDKWGKTPITLWSDTRMVRKVCDWRNLAAATPREADHRITVLRNLLEWGRLNAYVTINVAVGIPTLYCGGNRPEITWSEEDFERLAEVAPVHVMDGVRLATLTGLRRADLVSLKWDEVGEHCIEHKALKRSRGKQWIARVPLYPELKALLDILHSRFRKSGVETVLVNSFGDAWTGDGFGNSVIRARNEAGIVHTDGRKKHLHDIRGTFATRMVLAGLHDDEIANIMAWSPAQVAGIRRVYVDQSRIVMAIGARIGAAAVNSSVNFSS